MLDLVIKDFKAAIINVFRELNETILEELKESMITMTQKDGNCKKSQVEILELKVKFIRGAQ